MGKSAGGRHRAASARRDRRHGRAAGGRTAGIAVGGVALLALAPGVTPVAHGAATTPTISADARLAGSVYYLRGTNIGNEPTDGQYVYFVNTVLTGTGAGGGADATGKIVYPASIWPVSKGYLNDPKWNDSVAQGVSKLSADDPGTGDVVFGFSQGAVVASEYKRDHPDGTGATYVLVENPSRPNGGVMARFAGLTVPIMDLTFSGATPDNGDTTIDVARQYDGWADFPTYPLNLLATANAVMGIALVHGKTQTELTSGDLTAAQGDPTDSSYYQQHGHTTYYLIRTNTLPLLMPVAAVSPQLAAALDPPLRAIIETGYDRSDYSKATPAQLVPSLSTLQKSLAGTAADDAGTARTATGAAKLSAQATGAVTGAIATALSTVAPGSTTPGSSTPVTQSRTAQLSAVGQNTTESPAPATRSFTLPRFTPATDKPATDKTGTDAKSSAGDTAARTPTFGRHRRAANDGAGNAGAENAGAGNAGAENDGTTGAQHRARPHHSADRHSS